MKRDYTTEEFAWKVREIKKINPCALIATDIIVGYLDESDKDFETSYRFLETTPIDKFHVFRFSNRDKTAALYMKKRLPEAPSNVKIKRAKALFDLGRKKYQKFLQTLVDNEYQSQILFLDKFENGYQQALLNNQTPIWVKTKKQIAGKMTNVIVKRINNNLIVGDFFSP